MTGKEIYTGIFHRYI